MKKTAFFFVSLFWLSLSFDVLVATEQRLDNLYSNAFLQLKALVEKGHEARRNRNFDYFCVLHSRQEACKIIHRRIAEFLRQTSVPRLLNWAALFHWGSRKTVDEVKADREPYAHRLNTLSQILRANQMSIEQILTALDGRLMIASGTTNPPWEIDENKSIQDLYFEFVTRMHEEEKTVVEREIADLQTHSTTLLAFAKNKKKLLTKIELKFCYGEAARAAREADRLSAQLRDWGSPEIKIK